MARLIEKIGYGMGDMASSMFWKIFSYYLPIFYSDIFNLSLTHTATLMFVTRVWDAVSDPMMGIICDRTNTRWQVPSLPIVVLAALCYMWGIVVHHTRF